MSFFVYFVIVFLVGVECQHIEKGPVDTYTSLSKSVTLECMIDGYSPDTDLVEWCKNGFCTWGRPRELEDGRLQYRSLSKYFIVGDRKKGQWNLNIENITTNDEGEYKCTVTRRSPTSDKPLKVESNPAIVKLMRRPHEPKMDKSGIVNMIIGKIETLNCIIKDGVPAPTINWRLTDGTSLTKYSKLSNLNGTYTSKLDLNPTLEIESQSIQCVVEHPLYDKIKIVSIGINLSYAPILSITQDPNEDLVDGKTYTFTCKMKSKPETNTLKFYINDTNSEIESKNMITLTMNRNLHGKMIVCESKNEIGNTSIAQTLNVKYMPLFVETPNPIITLNNTDKTTQQLTLKCVVDSNPEASIVWLRNNKDLIEIGNQLNIVNIDASAEYTCKATNQYFDNKFITYNTSVIIAGAPTIIGEQTYSTEKDNNVNVEFSVLSNPSYQGVPLCSKYIGFKTLNEVIEFNNNNLNKNKYESTIALSTFESSKYKLEEIYDKNDKKLSTRHAFKINKITNNDFGVYVCTVSNQYGTSDFMFQVQQKADSRNLLIIILASILSVLLVLIVILIVSIVICKRRLRHQEMRKKALPSVSDDISSHNGNSPNLSVSEWVTNSSGAINDSDQSSDKSSSSQKNLLTNDHTLSRNTDTTIAIILPAQHLNTSNLSQFNSPISIQYERKQQIDSFSNYDSYQNYAKVPHYQSANISNSKFQTNV